MHKLQIRFNSFFDKNPIRLQSRFFDKFIVDTILTFLIKKRLIFANNVSDENVQAI